MDLEKEFDRQIQNLIEKGYPDAVGMIDEDFIQVIAPLKEKLSASTFPLAMDEGTLPFVIVISSIRMPAEIMMSRIMREEKEGMTKLFPLTSEDFNVIDSVSIPQKEAYLLVDIDRGRKTLNVTPYDALLEIKAVNRSPLTINEGIAIVTQFPDFLMKNNCFSLLASRHTGDQRVPAIWINGKKHPNLGWCWDGNPHTWLGSASCAERV